MNSIKKIENYEKRTREISENISRSLDLGKSGAILITGFLSVEVY